MGGFLFVNSMSSLPRTQWRSSYHLRPVNPSNGLCSWKELVFSRRSVLPKFSCQYWDPCGGSETAVYGSFKRKNEKTTKKITLLRVIPTMTCRVVVVRWGLSGWIGIVICATWITLRIIPTRDKEPWRNPSHLFSGILRALVVSCPPFSIAPGTSVCESKAQTCRRRNMPNHVRTPPGKHISINRHQTWQYTSWSKVKS